MPRVTKNSATMNLEDLCDLIRSKVGIVFTDNNKGINHFNKAELFTIIAFVARLEDSIEKLEKRAEMRDFDQMDFMDELVSDEGN